LTQAFHDLSGRLFQDGDQGAVRKALVYSLLLHLAILVMAVAGMPNWIDPDREVSPPVFEVQLAKLDDRTVQKPKPTPAPPAPEPPKPVEQKAPPPPPKPVEQKPEPPKPEPPKPEVVEPAPSAKPKPTPKAEPEKPKFDPQQIAALLDKRLRDMPAPAPVEPQKVDPASTQAAAASPETLEAPLSISEVDLIRSQFERCWNPPVGAREAENLVIRVRIALNPDGSLAAAPELIDRSRLNDTFWRAAADSALRAVHKCQPLQDLPSSKYQRWRLIDLTFNPKEMLG
jgi:outer membrane biosynthesis protein TonB